VIHVPQGHASGVTAGASFLTSQLCHAVSGFKGARTMRGV
jgi:hypothetical protein